MDLPTVCIANPAARSGFTRINVSDFDPARHDLLDPADVAILPPDVAAALLDREDDGDASDLAIGKGPGGRWCVKRGKERVSDLFETEAEAVAARAAMEG